MDAPIVQDFSFRLDRSENMVINSNYEYMKGIIAYLFGIRKGSDAYNPDWGLDLPGKRFTVGNNRSRDTEYEREIERQFAKYTEMIATNVVAYRKDGRIRVSFTLLYQNNFYETVIEPTDDSLSVVINNRAVGVNP